MKVKKPFYKRWWFVLLVIIVIFSAVAGSGDDEKVAATNQPNDSNVIESQESDEEKAEGEADAKAEAEAEAQRIADKKAADEMALKEAIENPVSYDGLGQDVISDIYPSYRISKIKLKHDGTANFIVYLYDSSGNQKLIVNDIGKYDGEIPLFGEGPYQLEIDADGAWSATIVPLQPTTEYTFAGKGDAVSGIITGAPSGTWEFTHDGGGNYIVYLHSTTKTDLLQNEIGSVNGAKIVKFDDDDIYIWQVTADGNWSIKPRE